MPKLSPWLWLALATSLVGLAIRALWKGTRQDEQYLSSDWLELHAERRAMIHYDRTGDHRYLE